MLLKCCQWPQSDGRTRMNVNKQQRNTGVMKMTLGTSIVVPRVRKTMRVAAKRPAPGKRIVQPVDPCDSSNDSGLGFEQQDLQLVARPTLHLDGQEVDWAIDNSESKRKKVEIKLESDDAIDNFTFEETMHLAKRDPMQTKILVQALPQMVHSKGKGSHVTIRRPVLNSVHRRAAGPNAVTNQLLMGPANKPRLEIINQPEQQHRARYQTEGSRGAVKDRTGNSFPTVKLVGFEGSAKLEVFIGNDSGHVVPHMFYQACRVTGKNSTPCSEKNVNGTVVIEVEFETAKEMIITCDCVGILKERNVDVEHRFPDQCGSRNKKKSTRCRMIFRTTIKLSNGTTESLEISSQPIVCTQPPGIPEICKKSTASCPCTGGQELFILGKNFLKDTRVKFTSVDTQPLWEVSVQPDKEYLQQSHLVCMVPPYQDINLIEPVNVRLVVISSGKTSESHSFSYTQRQVGNEKRRQSSIAKVQLGSKLVAADPTTVVGPPAPGPLLCPMNAQYLLVQSHGGGKEGVYLWKPPNSLDETKLNVTKLMPPPQSPVPSLSNSKRIAADVETCDVPSSEELKDLLHLPAIAMSSSPKAPSVTALPLLRGTAKSMATGADLLCTQSPSMATLRRFVSSENTLPSLSVEKFLSTLEFKIDENLVIEKSKTSFLEDVLQPDKVTLTEEILRSNQFTTNSHTYIPSNILLFDKANQDMTTTLISNSDTIVNSCLATSSALDSSYNNNLIDVTQEHMDLQCQSAPSTTISTVLCDANASNSKNILTQLSVEPQSNTGNLEDFLSDAADTPTSIFNTHIKSNFSDENLLTKQNALKISLDISPPITSGSIMMNPVECVAEKTSTLVKRELKNMLSPKNDTSLRQLVGYPSPMQQPIQILPDLPLAPAQLLGNIMTASNKEQCPMGNIMIRNEVITAETQRLDALVNSTLASHLLPDKGLGTTSSVLYPSANNVLFTAGNYVTTLIDMPHNTCRQDNKFIPSKLSLTQPHPSIKLETCQIVKQEKREEGMVSRELTQMSESDLISYINPLCFDTGEFSNS